MVGVGTFIGLAADDMERYIGGGVVVLAGVFMVRWALRTSERVEATYHGALQAAYDRAAAAEAEADRYQRLYETERELRVALEQSGLADRRKRMEER